MKAKITNKKLALCLIFALWLIANIWLCTQHEMFRDEAQSWMIAKHNNIQGIISFISEEGHPWLYHLMLYPLAHIGFPYAGLPYVSLALTAVSAILILIYAPFPIWGKTAFLFLPPIFYYASCFARNYTIIVLFAVIVGCLWNKRIQHPVLTGTAIGLFASTHLLAWLPALIIAILFLLDLLYSENRRYFAQSLLAIAIPVIIFDAPVLCPILINIFGTKIFVLCIMALIVCTALAVWFALVITKKRSRLSEKARRNIYRVLALLTPVASLVIMIMTVSVSPAALITRIKILSVICVVMLMLWIKNSFDIEHPQTETPIGNKKIRLILTTAVSCILIVALLLPTVELLYTEPAKDAFGDFSKCKETAQWIEENLPDKIIYTTQVPTTAGIVAYSPELKIYDPIRNEYVTYAKWTSIGKNKDNINGFISSLKKECEGKDGIYVLSPMGADDFGSEAVKWIQKLCDEKKAEVVYITDMDASELVELFVIIYIPAKNL